MVINCNEPYTHTTDKHFICCIKGCIDPYSHTTNGHSCRYCNTLLSGIGHSGNNIHNHMKLCPNNDNSICDDINNFNMDFVADVIEENNLKDGEYMHKYGGMGCTWFIRKNNNKNEYFFLHSDNMGQYGKDTSDIPRLNAFIYKYKLIGN